MRHEDWMCRDERTPEEIRRHRLRSLEWEEKCLLKTLDDVRAELKNLRAEGTHM